jgi:hypothetical protein
VGVSKKKHEGNLSRPHKMLKIKMRKYSCQGSCFTY